MRSGIICHLVVFANSDESFECRCLESFFVQPAKGDSVFVIQHCFEVGTIFPASFPPFLSPPMGPATQAHARTAVPSPMPSVLDALSSPHHPGPAIKDPRRIGLNRRIMWVTRLEVWVICVGCCDIRSPEKVPRSKVVHRPPGQEWAVGPKRVVGCHLVARFMSLDLLPPPPPPPN